MKGRHGKGGARRGKARQGKLERELKKLANLSQHHRSNYYSICQVDYGDFNAKNIIHLYLVRTRFQQVSPRKTSLPIPHTSTTYFKQQHLFPSRKNGSPYLLTERVNPDTTETHIPHKFQASFPVKHGCRSEKVHRGVQIPRKKTKKIEGTLTLMAVL